MDCGSGPAMTNPGTLYVPTITRGNTKQLLNAFKILFDFVKNF